MDSAREKISGHVVEAESLWDLEIVDTHGYECHGCGIAVYPASYEKGENKKRPYFSRRTNTHATDCQIDGKEKIVKQAAKGAVSRPEGFPIPYPNRLVLVDRRPTVRPEGDESADVATGGRTGTTSQSGDRAGGHHGHTCGTIRPMCRMFIDFPYDRTHLEAHVPGCSGSTYQSVFVRLPKSEVAVHPAPKNLYYAPLMWSRPLVTEEYIEWRLNAGEWDAQLNRRSETRGYRVRAMWNTWTKRQRDTVQYEMEVCRQEAINAKQTRFKAWLFCVGVQSADDPTLIVVDDHRLICGLMGDIT
jgi:hypothetical protein